MHHWAEEKCIPCEKNAPAASQEAIQEFIKSHPNWQVIDVPGVPKIRASFRFQSYNDGIEFGLKVAELSELEQHHPDLLIQWGQVTVTWWTHKINSIHTNDLIMAAKTQLILPTIP
jgi:4a-hydroxytetrahydrobiopterin dehydratase